MIITNKEKMEIRCDKVRNGMDEGMVGNIHAYVNDQHVTGRTIQRNGSDKAFALRMATSAWKRIMSNDSIQQKLLVSEDGGMTIYDRVEDSIYMCEFWREGKEVRVLLNSFFKVNADKSFVPHRGDLEIVVMAGKKVSFDLSIEKLTRARQKELRDKRMADLEKIRAFRAARTSQIA